MYSQKNRTSHKSLLSSKANANIEKKEGISKVPLVNVAPTEDITSTR